ncbi:acyltransferase [Geothrix mesophila]|uniref:acyltransferase n=1 Tax=Geothrix mesophila TaxID=2922723 RepID=UPI001FABF768|nr:acyltransferase [Geothrix sp. SG198]
MNTVWKLKKVISNLLSEAKLYLPVRFGNIGVNSYVPFPHNIIGGKKIYIGDRVNIGKYSYLHAIEKYRNQFFRPEILIGNDVYIGPKCYIAAVSRIQIQDGCVLSEEVYISDVAHGLDPKSGLIMEQSLISKGPVLIGKGCFIGLRAAIMPGVELGSHCIVASSAVVTQSYPDYSMLAGNPARLVKRYDPESGNWVKVNAKGVNLND